jgi:hypothetical protein
MFKLIHANYNNQNKIRLVSSQIILNYDRPKNKRDNIYLIYQYYLPKTKERVKEVQEALKRNIDNLHIDKIYLLNERYYTDKELGLENPTNKIVQEMIGRRILFRDIFTFVEKKCVKGYIMTCNSDIFFDNSISRLHNTDIDISRKIISLLRWEYRGEKKLVDCKLYGPHEFSQDSWIFHSNYNLKIPINNKSEFDIMFGQPGCDNRLLYLFWKNGFLINNNPIMFRTYHCHTDNTKQYNTTRVPPPYVYVIPEFRM